MIPTSISTSIPPISLTFITQPYFLSDTKVLIKMDRENLLNELRMITLGSMSLFHIAVLFSGNASLFKILSCKTMMLCKGNKTFLETKNKKTHNNKKNPPSTFFLLA